MEFMTVKEASEKWDLTTRSVQGMCKNGRIPGAEFLGRSWVIPRDAPRPADHRKKTENESRSAVPFLRESPYLIMTDLYRTPGGAEAALASLAGNPEAYALFDSQLAYHRGEIDRANQIAQELLKTTEGFIPTLGAGLMTAYCAMYRGDLRQWQKAREHILSAHQQNEKEHELAKLCVAIANSGIFENTQFPDWFRQGCFDVIPLDGYPAVQYCYAQYLFTVCYTAMREQKPAPSPYDIYHVFPQICELLISHTKTSGAILPELYLNLLCASGYHAIGENEIAVKRIDRAIDLALPDRLYAPLAEKRAGLDFLLDDRLAAVDKEALRKVRALNKILMKGWTALHNAVLNRHVSNDLTIREREVARMIARGFSNQEIAESLFISISAVKQTVFAIMEKTGATNRAEVVEYI